MFRKTGSARALIIKDYPTLKFAPQTQSVPTKLKVAVLALPLDVAAAMRADQRVATNGAIPADSEAATATVRQQPSACPAWEYCLNAHCQHIYDSGTKM